MKSHKINQLTTRKHLSVQENGGLKSSRFDDIYFYPQQGANETEHVFLLGNNLQERFQRFLQSDKKNFVVVETGFGTGLNFLCTWQLWLDTKQALTKSSTADIQDKTLLYYSIEQYPLSKPALQDCHQIIGYQPALSQALIEAYPDPLAGSYLLNFASNQIKLVLLFNEVAQALSELEQYPHTTEQKKQLQVDAWFLDGFSPAINPDMWNERCFLSIQQLSYEQTTLATFTVAKPIKEALIKNGFTLKKSKGFGKKREMLTATFTGLDTQHTQNQHSKNVFDTFAALKHNACYYRFSSQQADSSSLRNKEKTASVIGAGIAGCTIAYLLAKQGWQVNLIDKGAAIATGASGNQRAILYARTANTSSPLADFHEASLHYATNFYRSLSDKSLSAGLQGMIQLGEALPEIFNTACEDIFSRKNASIEEIKQLSGLTTKESGVYYPHAGYIEPNKICQFLIEHENIKLLTHSHIQSIEFNNNHWHCIEKNKQQHIQSNIIVLANAVNSKDISLAHWLPLKAIRGQTTNIPAQENSENLKIPLCHKGYITPAFAGIHNIGASFNLNNSNTDCELVDHQDNIQHTVNCLDKNEPFRKSLSQIPVEKLDGRVGFRSVAPDYLPIVGPIAQQQAFKACFPVLEKNAKKTVTKNAPLIDGLFTLTAFGSHGFTTVPLSAELLLAQIEGTAIPFSDKIRQAISPSRFLLRHLIRGTFDKHEQ